MSQLAFLGLQLGVQGGLGVLDGLQRRGGVVAGAGGDGGNPAAAFAASRSACGGAPQAVTVRARPRVRTRNFRLRIEHLLCNECTTRRLHASCGSD
ncbi:MAG: hypothetical protein MZV70_43385 [Desulfobacterales bacterium]|nr:hypothetical protein [Desulfobacterales bacterium]